MNPLIPAIEPRLVDFLQSCEYPLPALHLVDVGVSGGIYPVWRAWQDVLHAIGVDILEDEVEALGHAELLPAVRYEAMRVIGPDDKKADDTLSTNYVLHRAQCYLATRISQGDLTESGAEAFYKFWRETFDGLVEIPREANYANIASPMADPFFGYYARRSAKKETPHLTGRTGTLDELLASLNNTYVDILKIDTDGNDFDVLRGATNTLANGCFAVEIEVQFHGPVSPTANVFCNIDAFMRNHGFSLYKLEQAHYSRSALPRPFLYDIPAQTKGGPLQWGEAFYARDLIAPCYAEQFGFTVSDDRLRNLALIFDVYGLEDVAAEIILKHPGLFKPVSDIEVLDFLTKKVYGPGASYNETVDKFIGNCIVA